jgi:hypothetical protein
MGRATGRWQRSSALSPDKVVVQDTLVSAPKGRDSIAQGEALGGDAPMTLKALKGRDNDAARPGRCALLGLANGAGPPLPQGFALGYRVAPLRG